MIFFTGCTHFGHGNIIRLANRPFGDINEMNQELIKRWNQKVKPEDTVFHLGDIHWTEDKTYWFSRLNGEKIHIRGNHDRDGLPYKELNHNGRNLVLFHYPIEEWNGFYRGAIHLHCHTHSSQKLTAKNRVNITVEAWNYEPVSIEEVIKITGVT